MYKMKHLKFLHDILALELYDGSTSLTTSFMEDPDSSSITLTGGIDVEKNGTKTVLVAFQSGNHLSPAINM